MSSRFGIATLEPENFKLDMERFKEALQNRWSDVVITPAFDNNIDFGMTLRGTFDSFVGSTVKGQQITYWRRSPIEDFAEFAAWYRSLMPSEHVLMAWYGGLLGHFVLLAGATAEEIVQGFSGQEYICDIILSHVDSAIEPKFVEKMKAAWSGGVISQNENGSISWFIRSQYGTFDIKNREIHFSDRDPAQIAAVAKWCRNEINCDQKLIVPDIPTGKSLSAAQLEITLQTSEQEIIDHLEQIFMRE